MIDVECEMVDIKKSISKISMDLFGEIKELTEPNDVYSGAYDNICYRIDRIPKR